MKRSFRIYRCTCRCGAGNCRTWRWECTLCHPPAKGARFGEHAWRAIIAISLPHHFRVRDQHHAWVRSHKSAEVSAA